MPAFIASEEKQIVFYSIGTGNNRGAMGLGEFAAEKRRRNHYRERNHLRLCEDHLCPHGVFLGLDWAYWYDKQSGQLVQTGEKGKNAERTAIS